MTKNKDEHYVDIRFVFKKEVEDFGDGEVYETFIPHKIKQKKVKGLTEGDLDSIGESLAQMDRYQLMLANDVLNVICSGVTHKV